MRINFLYDQKARHGTLMGVSSSPSGSLLLLVQEDGVEHLKTFAAHKMGNVSTVSEPDNVVHVEQDAAQAIINAPAKVAEVDTALTKLYIRVQALEDRNLNSRLLFIERALNSMADSLSDFTED